METENLAYDFSLYEAEGERHIARREKKESVIIKAQAKFNLAGKIAKIIGVALALSLIIGVISTNAAVTEYTSKIASANASIVQLESEKAYLEFTLESKMSLDEIESYAVNELGMVKMDSSRKRYIELESENKTVQGGNSVADRFSRAVQPVMSYLFF